MYLALTVSTPQAVTLSEQLDQELSALLDHYKALSRNGMEFSEIWELFQSAVASAARVVKQANADDDTVLEISLAFAASVYDGIIAPIDLPKVPNVVEKRIVDPLIRTLFLNLVEGSIKSMIKIFGRTGWFDTPGVNGAIPVPVGPKVDNPVPATPDGFVPY